MLNFIPYDYHQDAMVVVNFEDQILPGTIEHTIHYLIEEKADLSAFDQRYRNEHQGRPAIDPAMRSMTTRIGGHLHLTRTTNSDRLNIFSDAGTCFLPSSDSARGCHH